MDELHEGDAELRAGAGEARSAAEGETALARLIMDGGDLPHAASHLGNAMAMDPLLPETHEALAELVTRSGGAFAALELFPADSGFTGAVACRAHLEAACGNWAEALMLLAAVVRAEPERPWTHVAWLGRDELPGLLPPAVLTQALARVVGGALPDPLPEAVRGALDPFYALIRAAVREHPGDGRLAAIASGLARRMGDAPTAVAWAEQGRAIRPDHVSGVMLGYALRAAGRADDALRVWQEEAERDPSDLSLMVDIAELWTTTGRAAEGLPWAERAVAADPGHPQAAPAVHGVRYAADGDPAHLLALADHLRTHPDHPYAATVLARHSEWEPWLGVVAQATEATVNVLHQMLESPGAEGTRGHEIQLATSAMEPPSAALAFLAAFPAGDLANQSAGHPDPREPVRPVTTQVWRYEGLRALPAVPPPSPRAAELLRDTASVNWPHIPAAYDHAVRLSGLTVADLLGVLVHPPAAPDDKQGRFLRDHRPELWIRGVQSFACLGLAHHRTDQPWPDSDRRRILLDLLDGPEDWVCEAAAFALVATAWMQPEIRAEAGERVAARLVMAAQAWQTREVTVLASLCRLVLLCPWLEESWSRLAREMLAAVRRVEEGPEPDDARERAEEMAEAARAASRDRRDRGRHGGRADGTASAGRAGAEGGAQGTDPAGAAGPGAGREEPRGKRRGLFRRRRG